MTPPAGAERIFVLLSAKIGALAAHNGGGDYAPGKQEGIPQNFGAPPRSGGGISRFLAMTRNFALGTFGLALLIFVAEKILPALFTPSHMIGSFVAAVEVSEIKSQQDYATGYAAAMAEAQAQAQARAQIEIEVNRQQQQRLSDSMGTQVFASNVADLGCYAGMLARAFGQTDNAATLSGACGAGEAIRQTMAQEQANIGRNSGSVETRQIYGQAGQPAPATITPAQTAPQGQAQPSSSDMKRIEYERQNQQNWEQRLGPVRVRTVKASLPEGSMDTEYLTALEQAFVHFHAHVLFQTAHQDQWEERVGKPRLIELKQGLAQGSLGLTDYLDRLEQAARQQ
jgi:hypothetical protein